ncbi:MAG: type II toxin-antitoxin system VapC family toxin [archaeon]
MKEIYLDTNSFYFFFFENKKYSDGIKKVFKKMQENKVKGITNCLTLDELAYITLMKLIEKKYKEHPSKVIRKSKKVLLEFVDEIKKMFDVIFSFKNLEIAEVSKKNVGLIPTIMEETLLLPRDCVHLRTMLEKGCKYILTTDNDFNEIAVIERIDPNKF